MRIDEPLWREKLPRRRMKTSPQHDMGTLKEHNRLMTFYPEGGNRIKGLSSYVAYKLTDDRGKAVNDVCTLYDEVGISLMTFTPLHEGMGVVE